jgi:tetratricopeptide (TPR) repeat protein
MSIKLQTNKISQLSHTLLFILIYSICCYNYPALAQERTVREIVDKEDVLEKTADLIEEKYVLSEKAEDYANRFREKYENKYYDSYTNASEFAQQVTRDLVRITGDKHISFRVKEASDMGEKSNSPLHHPLRYHLLGIKENQGFSKLEWMEGNIGYLDLRRFYLYSDVKEKINATIKFLSKADAIIIDIRHNGGGSGDYLSSYFLPYPTQLNGWYSREEDYVTEYWTMGNTGIEPLTDVPLFILTSDQTFSAAESFAYDMQVRERAVLVGDSTKGGAHSVDLYQINEQFEIYISTVRAINPLTGENWEGKGVIPDILVSSESALDTAMALAKKAGEEFARTKDDTFRATVKKMETCLEQSEKLFQENEDEKAVILLDSVFVIAEKLDLINEFFIIVLAYNYYSQDNQKILFAILNKRIALFPTSPDAYESLAYAYYRYGEKDQAIGNYKKALKLDPGNRNVENMIKRIQNE